MSRVDAAAGMDRLPWLPDEPQPRPERPRGNADLLGWVVAGVALLAGAGFWMGGMSVDQQPAALPQKGRSTTTVRLPEPRNVAAPEVRIAGQPEVTSAPAPVVRPSPAPDVRIALPARSRVRATAAAETKTASSPKQPAVAAAPVIATPRASSARLRAWPPRVVAGAAGRLVQVGAFGTARQAKRGWWFMVRAYPAVAHLPAVVTVARNSKGVPFYRFQVGTTSQAHSEVLCQRMQKIRFSCAVVGLPWKPRVER